jgi:hypothetical protein
MEIGLPEIGWLEIGDWISCCALLARWAHSPVKIKTVFLKINIFLKIF